MRSHCRFFCRPHFSNRRRVVPSPLGEKVPEGRMRGFSSMEKEVAPHQFGQMTYDRAIDVACDVSARGASVSHGLTSSPPRGEGEANGQSKVKPARSEEHTS